MSSSSAGKHARTGVAGEPPVPEPSFAEQARTLMYLGRVGSLSTLSRKQRGFPFGSVMPYAVDERGRPVFLISTMAMHTQNLQADARASLLVTRAGADRDPLGASRVTVLGRVMVVAEPEVAAVRTLYLASYANSKHWVDYEDFSFYRMEVADVYYVGGFGVMGWILASEYERARPDPLADAASDILQHMNSDHKDALIRLASKFSGIEAQAATMTSVDRLGLHLRLETNAGMRGTRIAFLREVRNPAEVRKVLVEMLDQGRQP